MNIKEVPTTPLRLHREHFNEGQSKEHVRRTGQDREALVRLQLRPQACETLSKNGHHQKCLRKEGE